MSSSPASNGGTRREVLAALGCAASIWALLPRPAFWAGSTGSAWMQTLQYLIFRPQFAQALGELYRQHFPSDDLSDWPRDLMAASGLAHDLEISSLAIGQLRDSLEARIRRDFVRGDIVQLQGWVLSRTEARLCALYR